MNQLVKTEESLDIATQRSILEIISTAAKDPAVDVEKMERMFALLERTNAKSAELAFNDAMNRAQSMTHRIKADRTNNQTRSQYATYAALDRALRPIYTECGFSLSFDTAPDAPPEVVRVLCYVSHKEGHTRTYRVEMPADGKGAKGGDVMTKTHAAGSAMSYGSRYLLKLIFNVAIGEDDDDGNGAQGIQRITEEQEIQITEMLEATNSDKAAFLRWCKLDRIGDIPAARFDSVMAQLKKKERK